MTADSRTEVEVGIEEAIIVDGSGLTSTNWLQFQLKYLDRPLGLEDAYKILAFDDVREWWGHQDRNCLWWGCHGDVCGVNKQGKV